MGICRQVIAHIFLFFLTSVMTEAKDKVYYIAIQEIMWDYAPSGINLITNNRLKDEPISRIYSDMYIGKRYKKAVYRRYTDVTYEFSVPHDPNLGFMGPTIRAEVGDRVIVYLFNNGSRPYSAHPHGLFYTKENEGARYEDNSSADTSGGAVPSGGRHTYIWEARPEFGPAEGDPNCLTWAYHSHTNSPKDINSGLIGALIVCRPGTYREDETRIDVNHEFVAMFFIPHERDSWYFWENLRMIPSWEKVDINEKYFEKGNEMHVVNAYMYGNTPGYDVCQGDTISWHILGMGTNRDLHPIQFQGQTVMRQHHRTDNMIVIPAAFSTLLMKANNPGRWLISCRLYSHFTEGMTAWLSVDPACRDTASPLPSESLTGRIREYFLAAEEVMWDYAPYGMNRVNNQSLLEPGSDSKVFFETGPERIGGVYKKAVFRGYTDATFTTPTNRSREMGYLGPVIEAEIGDTIRILFKNTAANKAFNIEPQGVYFQDKYPAPPQSTKTYTWTLPNDVAPSESDPNCITYVYASTVTFIEDSNAGLLGPLLVCKNGTLESEIKRKRKFILMKVFDENKSWYFEDNLRRFLPDPSQVDIEDEDFEESNLMHNMNGLMYGNLELELCAEEDTFLHVMAIGTDVDMHSMSFDGMNVKVDGENTGVVGVFAHTTQTAVIRPEYVGRGRLFCRTIDHTVTGMSGIYKSKNCGETPDEENTDPEYRDPPYYIAAEEVIWDFNPRRVNIYGESVDIKGVMGYLHAHNQPGKQIGSRYKKVLYFEYTDDTFTTRKQKPGHLGFLGPIIKGEVGETISVLFRNNASRPYNMFPWGAVDEAANNLDNQAVEPGETKQYFWKVPESAGPADDQPACQSFVYVSNVDPAIDPIDGLMGPLLVCKRGSFVDSASTDQLIGVDQEFYLQFLIVDENLSHYLDENIQEFLGVDPATFEHTDEFAESNEMKAINGYLWHVEDLVMRKGDLVRWHLIGWGNEKDYHSVHFHAHTYVHVVGGAHRGDVFQLFPGTLGTVEMTTVEPGNWLVHCHVFDHIDGGMETIYSVLDEGETLSNNSAPMLKPPKKVCKMELKGEREEYNCKKMNITTLKDFLVRRTSMPVLYENGTRGRVNTSSVQILDLSDNRLTTPAIRKLLRLFPNLLEVSLNNNKLTRLPGLILQSNPHLHTLKVRKNLQLDFVPKTIARGIPTQNLPPRNFRLLDLSDNPRLRPLCLNQAFPSSQVFLDCFSTKY